MMLHFYNIDGRCCVLTFNFHSTFWNTYSCSFLRLSIIYIKFIFINKKYWKLGSFFRLNIFRLITVICHFHLGTLSTYKQKDAKSVSLCTALQIQCPIFIQMTPISQCQHEILVQRHLVPLFSLLLSLY